MKTLIIYDSNHGTTEKVARLISKKLDEGSCQLIKLKKNPKVNFADFDRIIIGGSIHAGTIQGSVKSFCNKNLPILLHKKVALFMCGMNKPELENEFVEAFPLELRLHAVANIIVGGEYILERMNFIERLIIKKIAKVDESSSHLNYEKIDELIAELSAN